VQRAAGGFGIYWPTTDTAKAVKDIENNPKRVLSSERKGLIRGSIFELQFATVSDETETESTTTICIKEERRGGRHTPSFRSRAGC
jgi:hypothetical protein